MNILKLYLNSTYEIKSAEVNLLKEYWMIHYSDVIMNAMASQITGISIVCSTVCSGIDHQISESLAFLKGIHRWIPPQRASNAGNISLWRRHNVVYVWCGSDGGLDWAWHGNAFRITGSFFFMGNHRSMLIYPLLLAWARYWINSQGIGDLTRHAVYLTSPQYSYT